MSKKDYDVDEAIKVILEKENMQPGTFKYDPKALHPMNLEYADEYVDEDDPGFDTYVVNEENFVASCQELARLNEFPVRAIDPDTAKEMAFRERFKKQQEAIKERNKETKSTVAKKLKNNDSALLLKELSKKKKRGEDIDEADIAAARKERSERVS